MAAAVLLGLRENAPWWGYFFLALIVVDIPMLSIYAIVEFVPAAASAHQF